MPAITAKDGTTISFSDQGKGLPLLFLHGWLMSRRVWHFQLPLAAEFRIITLDLRGHGGSDSPIFSYAACLDDIEQLLDHLGIDNLVIVGWSMGAQIAISSCARLQGRVSGLVLVGGTSCFCTADGYAGGLPKIEARGMAIRVKRDYREASGHFFRSMFSAQETAVADLLDIAAKTTASLPPRQLALAALQELIDSDLRGLLAKMPSPALLVHGAEDRICPVGAAEFMADRLPLASLMVLPDAGHAPFLTAAERFNAAVTAFVRTAHGKD
jgi:pimeloyl-[acyl-carrier protein] methyl ester esterase